MRSLIYKPGRAPLITIRLLATNNEAAIPEDLKAAALRGEVQVISLSSRGSGYIALTVAELSRLLPGKKPSTTAS